MLRGYIRPDARVTEAKQRASLKGAAVADVHVYVEAKRKISDPVPVRDAFIRALRKSDTAVVSHFHRIAFKGVDLRAVLKDVKARGATILEADTGRRSGDAGELTEMIFEAMEFYRTKGLTHDQAVKLGREGAKNSPAAKSRDEERMPNEMAKEFWNDRRLSGPEALAAINADERFPEKYTQSTAYRTLGKRVVPPGRRPKVGRSSAKPAKATRKKPKLSRGHIYFVRASETGPVKIGFSTGYAKRIASLGTNHHEKLHLVGLIVGTQKDEQRLHKQFAKYRIRREWFKVEGALKQFLAKLPKPELA